MNKHHEQHHFMFFLLLVSSYDPLLFIFIVYFIVGVSGLKNRSRMSALYIYFAYTYTLEYTTQLQILDMLLLADMSLSS